MAGASLEAVAQMQMKNTLGSGKYNKLPPVDGVRKQCLVLMGVLMLFLLESVDGAGTPGDVSGKQEVQEKLAQFDRVIQGYAFKAFRHPRTGTIYNVDLPSSLEGVKAQTVRLRTGSLRRRGFVFNEFNIPTNAGAGPTQGVVRVVLVYRQFTTKVYAPKDYVLVSPVLGIKVYDAFNLSTTNPLPELDFVTSSNITVRIPFTTMAPGVTPLCASFDNNGNMSLSNISSSPNVCSTNRLGDFALVIPSLGPAPAPSPLATPPVGSAPSPLASLPPTSAPTGAGKSKKSRRWKIILGSVLGGFAALLVLALLVFAASRYHKKSKISKMEHQADRGEMLQTSVVGSSRAPTAGVTRTRPVLENDYAAS